MNKLIRFAVAGALVAGYHTAALAQAQPSSDNADLWLFVADPTTHTTFAEDTGITLNSLMPSADLSAGQTLSTAITDSVDLSASAALASYISSSGASNLEWAVEGIQYSGSTFTGAKNPGGIIGVTGNNLSPTTTASLQESNLKSWGGGFQQDVTYMTPTAAGGAVYAWSSGGVTGQVWGQGPGNIAGSTDLYGNGADTEGVGLGSSVVMYGLTGGGSTGQVSSYILNSSLELTAAGTLEAGAAAPVPLPAALWLFGSGLLGLAGIGRRRASAA